MQYYGQFETDKVISRYFLDDYIGSCIEIGAANGIKGSNTKYFEDKGWKVLCIEPIPEYYQNIKKIRQNALQIACGSENKDDVDFHIFDIGENNIFSSLSGLKIDKRLVESHKDIINDTYKISVNVRTLDFILENTDLFIDKIDFISIDTENTEIDVIKGFKSLLDWNVTLLVIENNFNDPDVEDYLKQYGYRKDQRYKINDFYVRK